MFVVTAGSCSSLAMPATLAGQAALNLHLYYWDLGLRPSAKRTRERSLDKYVQRDSHVDTSQISHSVQELAVKQGTVTPLWWGLWILVKVRGWHHRMAQPLFPDSHGCSAVWTSCYTPWC